MKQCSWDIVELVVTVFESFFLYWWFFKGTCEYREVGRKRRWLFMVLFPLCTYLFGFIIGNASIRMWLLLIIGSILVCLTYQCTIQKAFIRNVFFMFILIVSESTAIGILSCIHGIENILVFLEPSHLRMQGLILSKLFNVILIVLYLKFSDRSANRDYTAKEVGILLMQAFSSMLCLLMVIEFAYHEYGDYGWSTFFLTFLGCFVLIAYIVTYYFINEYFVYQDRKKELLLMEKKANAMMSEYKKEEERQAEIYALYHDLKKHLAVTNMMENKKEINDYLERCVEGIHAVEGECQTGNQYADMLLSDEWEKADELGITTRFVVEKDSLIDIDLHDIVAILGNALENAREASQKRIIRGESAYIELKSFTVGSDVILIISNRCSDNIVKENGIFRTTKAEKEMHGIGLKSMERSVRKYDGNMNVKISNGKFVVTIMLKRKNSR